MIWYKDNDNIVISSRIRLARNLDDTPFPNALRNKEKATDRIKGAVLNTKILGDFKEYNMKYEKGLIFKLPIFALCCDLDFVVI